MRFLFSGWRVGAWGWGTGDLVTTMFAPTMPKALRIAAFFGSLGRYLFVQRRCFDVSGTRHATAPQQP